MSLLEIEAESSALMRTTDVDSHEMAPTHVWGKMFGENTARFGELGKHVFARLKDNNVVRPELNDDAEITRESVWQMKGPGAPGAFDFRRRLQVLDSMGTRRQLVFPTSALMAFSAMYSSSVLRDIGIEATAETMATLKGVCDEYNAWTLKTTAGYGDRYRPAAMLVASNPHELITRAADLIEAGARALWLPTSAPPAGRSPADPDLDPFWAMAAAAKVPVVLHIGTEGGFRASQQWAAAPAFHREKVDSLEITLEPFGATTLYMVPSAYVTAMVMGGVFERHPELRFGVIELGASWFGPLAEHLDVWAATPFKTRMSSILSMPPSAYFARTIRVTPFYFERVNTYFERWPELQDCYCSSTDYPHQEGGRGAKERFYEMVKPFGQEIVEKFFVTNGEWLMPE